MPEVKNFRLFLYSPPFNSPERRTRIRFIHSPSGEPEGGLKEEKEPVKENATLRPVEEGDIIPYEDPMMQFAEQARTLRERGNRVIQRVSMNSIPPDNYPLNDL